MKTKTHEQAFKDFRFSRKATILLNKSRAATMMGQEYFLLISKDGKCEGSQQIPDRAEMIGPVRPGQRRYRIQVGSTPDGTAVVQFGPYKPRHKVVSRDPAAFNILSDMLAVLLYGAETDPRITTGSENESQSY